MSTENRYIGRYPVMVVVIIVSFVKETEVVMIVVLADTQKIFHARSKLTSCNAKKIIDFCDH